MATPPIHDQQKQPSDQSRQLDDRGSRRPTAPWTIAKLHYFCLLTQSELIIHHVRDADRTHVGVIAR